MKLQPNYSWQKYEGDPEDKENQFQYQLQQQHIQVANSVNATIDDESFFTRERATSFTWINNKQIYTKTITGSIVAVGLNNYPHGITNIETVIAMEGAFQPTGTFSSARPFPYVDPAAIGNCVGLFITSTDVVINNGNVAWNGHVFGVTIYYTKTR